MARLEHLGRVAEEKAMRVFAMRAEELRGKVAGYYVDRQVVKQDSVADMSEKTRAKMKQITEDYGLILEEKKMQLNRDQLINIIRMMQNLLLNV